MLPRLLLSDACFPPRLFLSGDEKNWSVFRRGPQDPPLDETTSTLGISDVLPLSPLLCTINDEGLVLTLVRQPNMSQSLTIVYDEATANLSHAGFVTA